MLDYMKKPFFGVETSDNEEIAAQVKMYERLFEERIARGGGKYSVFV